MNVLEIKLNVTIIEWHWNCINQSVTKIFKQKNGSNQRKLEFGEKTEELEWLQEKNSDERGNDDSVTSKLGRFHKNIIDEIIDKCHSDKDPKLDTDIKQINDKGSEKIGKNNYFFVQNSLSTHTILMRLTSISQPSSSSDSFLFWSPNLSQNSNVSQN